MREVKVPLFVLVAMGAILVGDYVVVAIFGAKAFWAMAAYNVLVALLAGLWHQLMWAVAGLKKYGLSKGWYKMPLAGIVGGILMGPFTYYFGRQEMYGAAFALVAFVVGVLCLMGWRYTVSLVRSREGGPS